MSAPFGYVVNDKYVNISVDTDTAFETDGDTNDAIITVEYSDAPAVGELTVEKKGEVLDGFKGGLLASSYEKEFVYKEGSLAGAKFKVYAAEDIYTADNQKDADGNRIKYYSKGDLVTTLTTGKDGKATAKNLSLGQYRVVEVEAPYGYVLNPNEQKVTFTYVDDKTPVIKESLTFSDDRQKDGKVLDTLTTDKNGHAESKELPICTYNEDGSFKEDIHYTVVETKAADGYILDETAHDVTLRYDDNAPDVVVTTLKLINVPTEPKLPQTGDNANPLLYLGIGALALITGVGVGLRGRKKKNKQ